RGTTRWPRARRRRTEARQQDCESARQRISETGPTSIPDPLRPRAKSQQPKANSPMTTIDLKHGHDLPAPGGIDTRPYHERYKHAPHFRTQDAEFDAVKLGMWLFLATEV